MNKTDLTRFAGKAKFLAKKNAPHILVGVGIVGGVTAAVMACRATADAEDAYLTMHQNVDAAKGDVSEKQRRKNVTRNYARGWYKVARCYAPAVGVGALSAGCILYGHGLLHKRGVAAIAALAAVEQDYTEFRKRIAEEFGQEKVEEILHKVEERKEDDAEGPEGSVKYVGYSPYAKIFDEYNLNWSRDPGYNALFVTCQQNSANDQLRARGHLFLNEVYDMLGIPRTTAGQFVGWIYGGDGDDFVDFGIADLTSENARSFINGPEKSILLDFNVDGEIWSMI